MSSFLSKYISRFTAFTQVVIGLPLALDLLGQESFLLLSLFITAWQTVHATLYLACKNTTLSPVVSVLSFFGVFVPGLLFTLVFYLHISPPTSGSISAKLHEHLPILWSQFLRFSSPIFVLCEGLASLLVIQALGKTTKAWIDDGERDGRDGRGVGVLVASSTCYVVAIWSLIRIFPPAPSGSAYPPFLLGVALTTVLFLTLIGFKLRRTNVVETSLVLAYLTWSVWLLAVEGGDERAWGEGWLVGSGHKIVTGSEGNEGLREALAFSLRHVGEVTSGLLSSLPLPLLIALIYRITVLHAASRIVLFIRKQSTGWDPASSSDDSSGSFWDGRRLGEEPPSARFTTILLSYRRAILVAVYTHLLLLDQTKVWWRWASISLFLLVWAAELVFDGEEDDQLLAASGTGGLGLGGMTLGKEWKVD